jgi:hypothetical protein
VPYWDPEADSLHQASSVCQLSVGNATGTCAGAVGTVGMIKGKETLDNLDDEVEPHEQTEAGFLEETYRAVQSGNLNNLTKDQIDLLMLHSKEEKSNMITEAPQLPNNTNP